MTIGGSTMSSQDEYQKKLKTTEKAVKDIKSSD